jgi:hypothetical protein
MSLKILLTGGTLEPAFSGEIKPSFVRDQTRGACAQGVAGLYARRTEPRARPSGFLLLPKVSHFS